MTQQITIHPVAQAAEFAKRFLDTAAAKLQSAYNRAIQQKQSVASVDDNKSYGTLHIRLQILPDSVRITAWSDDPEILRELHNTLTGMGLKPDTDNGGTITLFTADKIRVDPALLANYDQMLAGLASHAVTNVTSPPKQATKIWTGARPTLEPVGLTPTDIIPPEVPAVGQFPRPTSPTDMPSAQVPPVEPNLPGMHSRKLVDA